MGEDFEDTFCFTCGGAGEGFYPIPDTEPLRSELVVCRSCYGSGKQKDTASHTKVKPMDMERAMDAALKAFRQALRSGKKPPLPAPHKLPVPRKL